MAVGTSGEAETTHLLKPINKIPKDTYHLAYIIYFTIGVGYLLPWNAFITAVDYFTYLYPNTSIDRTFAVVYMLVGLICLLFILAYAHNSTNFVRINVGFVLFVLALVVVPLMDVGYVKGRVGVFSGFYVAVGAIAVCGIGDALVQASIIGSASEMPERYMQAVVAGTGVSGVLVCLLRLLTKAIYPQDAYGLRKSANLYFMVSIAVMIICIVMYNVVHRLPVIKYYNDLKLQAIDEEKEDNQASTSVLWGSTLWETVGTVKWYGYGIVAIYVMTLCIFPGYITEDVHSYILNDWYPILLVTGYNLFDLVGKSLTAIYMLENAKVAIGASFARLLLLPLFYGCLHGPQFFRTEIPVTVLTCLLGLTNGYLTSVLMILGTKAVLVQHAETAGIVLVIFLVTGLSMGSVVSWFWVI
ncbi:Equilibrative nucleotide transporter 1 [Heracleum sosnowskyi]|uniref:Equilibrative nucleotide transporter 1 n=1 Tax=Heracleum sosnowskyi TaxID=360622 RepID=A0AAD8JIV5_9APIA|nr:Equilibrative nucleotide transporter 1 [Heracleum sosnowskyi]